MLTLETVGVWAGGAEEEMSQWAIHNGLTPRDLCYLLINHEYSRNKTYVQPSKKTFDF